MRKTKIDIIKNAFLSSLSVVEELLWEIESVFDKKDKIFVKVRKSVDEKKIFFKINEIKEVLENIKKKLNITEEEITDRAVINSRCAKIWEILNDLKTDKLKRYGEIPDDIKLIIEPSIKKMIDITKEIVDLVSKKK